jgi:hypothetical protein
VRASLEADLNSEEGLSANPDFPLPRDAKGERMIPLLRDM